ncbi:MAG TPA: hypothetical protein VKB93_09945 [Thermoanaerobaculia bacterium]|nr:hypothetical protein [Thermoanaerobaculia bacterium]
MRREVFSLYHELRIAAWAGAMMLAAAAGIALKDDLSLLLIPAAIACYAWVWWHRSRAALADDYILLLGALLVSAEVLTRWPRQFLPLAVIHGLGAYVYRSRLLLSLSISALAAFMGIERRTTLGFNSELAPRAFLTAAMLIAWRQIHVATAALSGRDFLRVFEYFAMHLTLWGSLTLLSEDRTFTLGCLLTIAFAAAAMAWGFKQRSEPFVLIAFVYGVIAAIALLVHHFNDAEELVVLVGSFTAIVALIAIDRSFRARRA